MSIQSAVQERRITQVEDALVEVLNESHMHSVPANSETHFKVTVVSPAFGSLRRVARHQMIYGLLQDFIDGPVHALALHLYTPEEWAQRQETSPQSPDCHGGDGSSPGG